MFFFVLPLLFLVSFYLLLMSSYIFMYLQIYNIFQDTGCFGMTIFEKYQISKYPCVLGFDHEPGHPSFFFFLSSFIAPFIRRKQRLEEKSGVGNVFMDNIVCYVPPCQPLFLLLFLSHFLITRSCSSPPFLLGRS